MSELFPIRYEEEVIAFIASLEAVPRRQVERDLEKLASPRPEFVASAHW